MARLDSHLQRLLKLAATVKEEEVGKRRALWIRYQSAGELARAPKERERRADAFCSARRARRDCDHGDRWCGSLPTNE